jgi:hypothetical protein
MQNISRKKFTKNLWIFEWFEMGHIFISDIISFFDGFQKKNLFNMYVKKLFKITYLHMDF